MTPTAREPDDDALRVVADQARVAIFGEVDAATAPQLQQALAQALPDPGAELVVDCRGLEFIDSSGLNVFVASAKQVAAAGGRLVLESPNSATQRLFRISGLDQVVTIRQ